MHDSPADRPSARRVRSDPAETLRIGDALRRLAPALDRYAAHEGALPAPAHRAGTLPPEAADQPDDGAGLDAVLDEFALAVVHGCQISAHTGGELLHQHRRDDGAGGHGRRGRGRRRAALLV